jgi:hypothetical protein
MQMDINDLILIGDHDGLVEPADTGEGRLERLLRRSGDQGRAVTRAGGGAR